MGRYLDLLRNEAAGTKETIETKKAKPLAKSATPSETSGLDISFNSFLSYPQGEETAHALPPDDRHPAEATWRRLFRARVHLHCCIGRTREEAERLAWGYLQSRWYIEHGERVPGDLCAACRSATARCST